LRKAKDKGEVILPLLNEGKGQEHILRNKENLRAPPTETPEIGAVSNMEKESLGGTARGDRRCLWRHRARNAGAGAIDETGGFNKTGGEELHLIFR